MVFVKSIACLTVALVLVGCVSSGAGADTDPWSGLRAFFNKKYELTKSCGILDGLTSKVGIIKLANALVEKDGKVNFVVFAPGNQMYNPIVLGETQAKSGPLKTTVSGNVMKEELTWSTGKITMTRTFSKEELIVLTEINGTPCTQTFTYVGEVDKA